MWFVELNLPYTGQLHGRWHAFAWNGRRPLLVRLCTSSKSVGIVHRIGKERVRHDFFAPICDKVEILRACPVSIGENCECTVAIAPHHGEGRQKEPSSTHHLRDRYREQCTTIRNAPQDVVDQTVVDAPVGGNAVKKA